MTTPWPSAGDHRLAAACAQKHAPFRFTSRTNPSRFPSSPGTGTRGNTPALLISTSIGAEPAHRRPPSRDCSIEPGDVRLDRQRTPPSPAAPRSATCRGDASSSSQLIATSAPAQRLNSIAIAAADPLLRPSDQDHLAFELHFHPSATSTITPDRST